MKVSGYPDLLSYTRQNRATVQIRQQLDKAALETVTGLQSDLTAATNGQVGSAHLLGKALNDADHSQQLNTLSQTRITLLSDALSGAREAVNGLGTRASIGVSVENDLNLRLLSEEARGSLQSVMTALSTAQGPRNLLSGAKTDTPPFAGSEVLLADVKNILSNATDLDDANAQLDVYFNDPAGGFATNIYKGSDNNGAGLPIGNGETLSMDIKGNSDFIKSSLRGLAVMANAFEFSETVGDADFKSLYSSAAAFVSDGDRGYVTQEGNLGLYAETLNKSSERLSSEQTALTNAFNDMFGRDQFEAAAELQALQVQLQASYSITARLADLTLTNYLR